MGKRKNKRSNKERDRIVKLTNEERLSMLANLIVDRIEEDLKNQTLQIEPEKV